MEMITDTDDTAGPDPSPTPPATAAESVTDTPVIEVGGPKGPEPTRFGDWERGGRCIDF